MYSLYFDNLQFPLSKVYLPHLSGKNHWFEPKEGEDIWCYPIFNLSALKRNSLSIGKNAESLESVVFMHGIDFQSDLLILLHFLAYRNTAKFCRNPNFCYFTLSCGWDFHKKQQHKWSPLQSLTLQGLVWPLLIYTNFHCGWTWMNCLHVSKRNHGSLCLPKRWEFLAI